MLKGGVIEERPLIWHYPHFGNQGGEPSSIIRQGNWKMIHYWIDGRRELYQLDTDQGELNDLAAKNPERVEAMAAELEAYLKKVGAKKPSPWPGYRPEMAEQNRQNALKIKERLELKAAKELKEDWKPNADWWSSAGE